MYVTQTHYLTVNCLLKHYLGKQNTCYVKRELLHFEWPKWWLKYLWNFDNVNKTECLAIKIWSFCYNASYLLNIYINTTSLGSEKGYAK